MSTATSLHDAVLAPPLTRARLAGFETEFEAGLGGVIRARPEDFAVEEIPAYAADGRPGHLLVWMRKRALSTEQAIREVAAGLGVPRPEIGHAGLKDRDALTRQQISVPERAGPRIARFAHPAVELSEPRPHSHKLRRGHLRGNRFRIVVRELAVELELARARAEALVAALAEHGLDNHYGEQRFGKDARNLDAGLATLRGRRRSHKGDLTLSAGQSALFNLYLARRVERGLGATVLRGDILAKRETGGLFECEDPATDQARFDAGELVVTGPMFGSKMRAPSPGTDAAALEDDILAEARVTPAQLRRLGKRAPGTRRWLRVWPELLGVELDPASDALGPGLALAFTLPAGSYATVLLRELT